MWRFFLGVASRPEVGGRVPPEIVALEVETSDPLNRPVWFKFYTRLGEARLEEGRPAYRAEEPGTDRVTVYAVNESLGTASRTVEVLVTPPG